MTSTRSHRASLTPVVVFVAVLAGLAALTHLLWRVAPGLSHRTPSITLAEPPPGNDAYLAADRSGHVDHHVHYFGLDADAIQALRDADVLFLGNSRLMFALRPRTLDRFFAERNLDYYVMGFGFREGDRFPLEILRRFDIRPRLVVVNADGFFGKDMSEWAVNVIDDSHFEAVKYQRENEVTHDVRRVVHQLVPNWLDLFERPGVDKGREFIAYRSRSNGTWRPSPWPSHGETVPQYMPSAQAAPWTLDAARAFKQELAARGSKLVLTFVPTPTPDTREAADVAEELDVPLAAPLIDGLTSHDDSHLTEDSATIWTERFLQALSPHLPTR